MNPEQFLANFGHVTNAPEGIDRLREMIYNLAVTGALSEQRRDEGDGHSLLKEIIAKKQALSDAGAYKRSPKLENLRDAYNENLPNIPSSWAWSRLVEVGQISPKNEADDAAIASFASMSAISEMHSSAVASEDKRWGNIKKGYTHFANGDVVLAKITPCFENGKAAVMANLTNGIGAGTTELHVVRPITGVIEPGYIYVFIRSPYFKIFGEGHMTGTAGQKRLPTEYFATRPFPLPPLAEQGRIVAKVDELMALCDQLEAQQEERARRFPVLSRTCHARFAETPIPANLNRIFDETGSVSPDDLRRTILTLAVQGDLVPQNPKDETAAQLFERVKAERELYAEENRFRTSQENPIDESAQLALPSTWRWARMSSLFNAVTDGDHLPPPKSSEGIAFLTIGNISTGKLNFEGCRFVPRAYYEKLATFRQPLPSDLLYTVVGATYGRPALVETERPFCVQRHIAILKPTKSMDVNFLLLVLQSPFVYDQATKSITGTAQPTIPLNALRNFLLPLPPLAEQRRIVAKVKELIAMVDYLEERQQERDRLANAFAKSCVASFTGTAQLERPDKMKAPKTQLVSVVTLGKKPKPDTQAPLAMLLSQNKGTLSAKSLWQQSGLTIDAFYQQLKTEIAQGWITPPAEAEMRILEEA